MGQLDGGEVVLGEHHREDGFELSEQPIGRMLQTCVALEELHVLFWNHRRVPSPLQRCVKNDFCVSIAKNCPRLKKLLLGQSYTCLRETSLQITDSGLVTLSTLPLLQSIGLMQTRCTSKGILALILNAPDPSCRRQIALQVGCANMNPTIKFFDVVTDFMELLVEQPECSFCGRVFDFKFIVQEAHAIDGHDATRVKLISLHQKLKQQQSLLVVVFSDSTDNVEDIPGDLLDIVSISILAPSWIEQSMIGCFDTNWVATETE